MMQVVDVTRSIDIPHTNTSTYPPSNTGDYWSTYPYWQSYVTVAPTDCSGDIHVFPCPHCDKCKCGGATKAKAKR